MTSNPIELGALLDSWVTMDRASLVESDVAVTVSRLDAAYAKKLLSETSRLEWNINVEDAGGERCFEDDICDELGPFIATIYKNIDGADYRLLTQVGFRQALAGSGSGSGVWQIASAQMTFATGTISFNPWGHGDVFAPAVETKSPLDLVREAAEQRLVPADIRKWLLRGRVPVSLWRDEAFQVFATVSAMALIRSLASEVVGEESLVFSGPPRLHIGLQGARLVKELGLEGYQHLQDAVAWVYEDRVSAEQRHALFAAEFSRSVIRGESIGRAFQIAGRDILASSRLAFQLSQSELSREAIKAQGDLRKAIADDMARAVEGTRSLAGAVAVAIATTITLIAAKSTGVTEPWVLSVIGNVVAAYLIVVAFNGWAYLWLQRRLRAEWQSRLYRFVPPNDYEQMVTKPARSAEWPYHIVGGIAVIVAFVLAYMACTIDTRSLPLISADDALASDEASKIPTIVTQPSPKTSANGDASD